MVPSKSTAIFIRVKLKLKYYEIVVIERSGEKQK
jgi:hypothetical protein